MEPEAINPQQQALLDLQTGVYKMEISTTNINSVLVQIGNALQVAKKCGLTVNHYFDKDGFFCACDTLARGINLSSKNTLTELNNLLRDIYAITPSTVAMQSIDCVSQNNHLVASITPVEVAPLRGNAHV